jgi:LmbE family N-acetylglucosaminyl deacetylase
MITILVASVLAVAGVVCAMRIRWYRRCFSLPVHRMDRAGCGESHATIAVVVQPSGFDLPRGLELRGRTVFLQLMVKASWLGRLRDPFIAHRTGERTYRQYFERGASGQRFLNLSPHFQHSDPRPISRVDLGGRSMRWAKEASLLAFEAPAVQGADVLSVAPHPDDAEIATFGLYATHRSYVATVTAGERGSGNLPAEIPASSRSRWAALLRVADSLSVPQLGHVPPERRISLVYPDGTLESMHREPSRAFRLVCEDSLNRSRLRSGNQMPEFRGGDAGCTWNDLVNEMRLLLQLTQPDVVVCPHPLIDSHPDHVFTTVAIESAVSKLPGKRPLFLLYVVHQRGAPLFPFGPANTLVSLSPGLAEDSTADAIYSHQLEPELQLAKYFAIEAMHACRSYTDTRFRGAGERLKVLKRKSAAFVTGIGFDPVTFLRRAARPNEIYYVASWEMLSKLVAQVFKRRAH